jgi:cyclophilin family peptidyl-prolyl cis-trans isomerase
LDGLTRLKLGNLLQIVIILAVIVLVWEAHHKATFASEQLLQFKDEENLLLLHLQQIERQSISLHENLSRLATSRANADSSNGNDTTTSHQDPAAEAAAVESGDPAKSNKGGSTKGGDLDLELIRRQTQQLYQMEDELNHELRALEGRIQSSSRNHIIQEFGEGPVQVVLDLDFGDQENGGGGGGDTNTGRNHNNKSINNRSSRISILLWHDTPHAAWTWLEQIGRHVWDGADFTWQQAHVIDATTRKHDALGGKIEFVEQSQHGHEAWTVGLKNSDGEDGGGLSMYINLQDNTHYHKHETCVGKVIDGFDALQRLLEVSRNRSYDKKTSIQIKAASAMHVTKREAVA